MAKSRGRKSRRACQGFEKRIVWLEERGVWHATMHQADNHFHIGFYKDKSKALSECNETLKYYFVGT